VSKSGAIFNWLVTLGEEVTFRGEAALGFPRGARLGRFGGRRGAGASLGNQHFLPEDLVQTHHATAEIPNDISECSRHENVCSRSCAPRVSF
jgi:hypothetical protein